MSGGLQSRRMDIYVRAEPDRRRRPRAARAPGAGAEWLAVLAARRALSGPARVSARPARGAVLRQQPPASHVLLLRAQRTAGYLARTAPLGSLASWPRRRMDAVR